MFKSIAWSQAAQKQLKPALKTSMNAVKREVLAGKAQLWSINNGELLVVSRVEVNEFVVVAVSGRNLYLYKYDIIQLAKSFGLSVIRFHTKKPEKIERSLSGVPLQLSEVRKKIGRNEYIYKVYL